MKRTSEVHSNMTQKPLKIVRLLEPDLCLECRFSTVAEVEGDDGVTRRMIRCRRLDCDNWDTTEVDLAYGVELEP